MLKTRKDTLLISETGGVNGTLSGFFAFPRGRDSVKQQLDAAMDSLSIANPEFNTYMAKKYLAADAQMVPTFTKAATNRSVFQWTHSDVQGSGVVAQADSAGRQASARTARRVRTMSH